MRRPSLSLGPDRDGNLPGLPREAALKCRYLRSSQQPSLRRPAPAISRHPRTIRREPEQRAEFGVVSCRARRRNMLHGYIVDPDTGRIVAVIRQGEVFRDDEEGAKIATVLNAYLYDLSGDLIGCLDGPHAIDVRTWSMPIALRTVLEGRTAHHRVPAVKQKGRPESRLLSLCSTIDPHQQRGAQ